MGKKFLNVLGNCLSFSFKRSSWTSERRIIEWLKKSMILLWIVYFIIQSISKDSSKSKSIFTDSMIVITEYVKKLPFINYFSSIRPVEVLLGMTIFWSLVLVVLWIFKKCWNYKGLPPKKFLEYDFDFQKNLVEFLNEKPQFGHNIYWLDGSWGSGKTHFLRTFFKNNVLKN